MGTQPLVTAATVTSIVAAIIALLVSFGINVTPEQHAAILNLVAIAAPWVVWLMVRGKVTPLSEPRDEDGEPLTRAGDEPTLKQQRSMGTPK